MFNDKLADLHRSCVVTVVGAACGKRVLRLTGSVGSIMHCLVLLGTGGGGGGFGVSSLLVGLTDVDTSFLMTSPCLS